MKSFILLFFILTGVVQAQGRTCVLSLFSSQDKQNAIVKKAFINSISNEPIDKNMDLFFEANLEQINRCFESADYSEVLLAAHGTPISSSLADFSMPLFYNSKTQRNETLKIRYFQKLSEKLRSNASIKKIRIVVCNLDFDQPHSKNNQTNIENENIRSSIDILIREAVNLGVEVDLSPKFKFGSWIMNEDVTRLTISWLRKSLDQIEFNKYKKDILCKKSKSCTRRKKLENQAQ